MLENNKKEAHGSKKENQAQIVDNEFTQNSDVENLEGDEVEPEHGENTEAFENLVANDSSVESNDLESSHRAPSEYASTDVQGETIEHTKVSKDNQAGAFEEKDNESALDAIRSNEAMEDSRLLVLKAEYESLAAEHRALKEERDSLQDSLQRTLAEFKNFRNRTEIEKISMKDLAYENLVVRILPVLDNFERTINAIENGASLEKINEGIAAIERQFRAALSEFNVSRIDSYGTQFDPERHEALASIVTDEHPENTIVDVIEPGYQLGKKVIRPAKVRVTKKPEKDSSE